MFCLINPILPGWNPDPTILRVGSDYFIATSTFEYYPGHPIYHSKDLVTWDLIGHALNRPSQLSLLGTPSDAGTNDIFSNHWSDPIYFDSLGYDANLFWDTNGDVYSTWSGINNAVDKIYSIYQNKVDLATGNSLTPAIDIFDGTLQHNSSSRPEGPHLYHINSTYYLLIAEGGTDIHHRATIQRGPTPSGPWESNPKNPILFNGADFSLPVQDTGHADMVQSPDGSWWGVALGVRIQNGNFSHIQLGREIFLFPVTWEDGWPVFNHGQPLSTHIPNVLTDKSHSKDYSNDFQSPTLDSSFYFVRTPYKPFHSLTARQGFLRLFGNSYAPGDRDSAALMLRKQTSYQEIFETQLDFKPTTNLTEAGVTIYYGDLLHNEIGITVGPDGSAPRSIIVRTIVQASQVGPWALTTSNATITSVTHLPLRTADQPVRLMINGSSTAYALGYAEGGDDLTFPATVDSAALSVAPAGGFFFKGASFGVYSTGTGKPMLSSADFAYWKQIPW
ncbi:hypothetical protein D9619_003596 [Psilocybe cf. subviscida]|uniref:Beta-xylosidase C-terminal Concanavalin A-like domain-containing protein n=1 Tax=Psilocybe cf. subviscida TaxID=2480587 RepID=A0A8H5ETI2_9AGAR|nr:hypothetical protein D9619_003596 [Psilocybe cf. subviscida]